MKCNIMPHFICVYTVCKGKKMFREKNTLFFYNYNLTPLDMYIGLSQVYCIKPEERIYKYTKRVNYRMLNVCHAK